VQLPEAGVILFSEDKASWRINSIWTKRTGSDSKGHFRIAGLMPGRYYIAAVPRQRSTSHAAETPTWRFSSSSRRRRPSRHRTRRTADGRSPDAGRLCAAIADSRVAPIHSLAPPSDRPATFAVPARIPRRRRLRPIVSLPRQS
jgi:hypothetical protein